MHQKLQMLNICMERRCIREGGLPFSLTSAESTSKGGGNEGSGKKKIDDSEDEFFDCANDDDEDGWDKFWKIAWSILPFFLSFKTIFFFFIFLA